MMEMILAVMMLQIMVEGTGDLLVMMELAIIDHPMVVVLKQVTHLTLVTLTLQMVVQILVEEADQGEEE